MATYISTLKFTAQGIKDIHQTTQRAQSLKDAATKMGVHVTGLYWTLGDHDGVLIFDAPDDETATALLLHLGTLGNVLTSTCRAFNAVEMDRIISKTRMA